MASKIAAMESLTLMVKALAMMLVIQLNTHWSRSMERTSDQTRNRFFRMFSKEDSGCWIWMSAKTGNGYGSFRLNGKNEGAHRASYIIFNGDIPAGLCVMHSCDNPLCVNPGHLSLGTVKDNAIDRNKKLRQAYGERNSGAKLTESQASEIISSRSGACALAKEYGVHRSTIHRIRTKRTWLQV